MPNQKVVLITGASSDEARRRRALAALSALESKGPDAIKVAETVLAIVESDSPRLRYTVGTDARVVPRLRQWLPESVFERGLAKTFALDDED